MNKTNYNTKEVKRASLVVFLTTIILCAIVFLIFYVLGGSNLSNQNLASYQGIYDQIVESYDGEVDNDYMTESIISGIVSGLNDPHSSYIYQKDEATYSQQIESSFEGIGISYVPNNDYNLVVTSVSKDGGAQLAGIYPGDIITSINKVKLTEDNYEEQVADIPNNETTDLTIKRPSEGTEEELTVTNGTVSQPSVSHSIISKDNKDYGYIKIISFAEETGPEFEQALTEIEKTDISGLIIDVRDNGGGYLNSVSEIADLILTDERPYLIIKKDGEVVEEYQAKTDNSKDYPIIGLQNQNTASASEVLNGALKELNGSEIVGTQSYGKGSVQTITDLKDYGSLRITIDHWFTPDGNSIDLVGITPTIDLEETQSLNVSPIILETKLDEGMYNSQNIQVNSYLNILGYDVNVGSNGYDDKTKAAVNKFQKDNNLDQTGVVDYLTADALYKKALENVHTYENDEYISAAIDSIK